MELSLTFFAFAIPAVIFAGISKGGFGSGMGFAATPFLALILSPGQAVGLMLPLLIVMDIAAVGAFWRKWDWPHAAVLMAGAIVGIALGTVIFGSVDPKIFKLFIGIVAVAFVLFQGARKFGLLKLEDRRMGRKGGVVVGAVTGLTSFISHAGGPPSAVYLLTQGLDKTRYQATSALAFFGINVMKVLPYAALGIFTRDTVIADIALIPVAFIGVALGVFLHKRVSDRFFFQLTYAFLLITGAKLIFDALG
ncbi:MAG: putative membrane protein YfcA [Halocynthiibacter sp.]|jgi:uncharacterized membrane protein YfcA